MQRTAKAHGPVALNVVKRAPRILLAEGALIMYRSGNKHRNEFTEGIWPLDFLTEGPDCL